MIVQTISLEFRNTLYQIFVEPIKPLKVTKKQAEKIKIHTGTALNYDKYSALLIFAATTHDNRFKWGAEYRYKYKYSVYDIEHLPIDDDKASFNIDYSVDII